MESATPRRGGRAVVIAVAVIAALALVAGSLWLFVVPTQAERQLAASTTALESSVEAVRSASTMDQLRAAGGTAQGPAKAAETFLTSAEEPSAELLVVSRALSGIAALAQVSGESPEAWQAAQSDIRAAAGLTPAVQAAADNADALIMDATARYAAWQEENAAAVAARDGAIGAAESYRSNMQAAIDDYIAQRNRLSRYIEVVDTEGSTVEEGYEQFANAGAARRAIRNEMAALTPPPGAAAADSRLLAVIGDGIAAIESAERALDSVECYWGECYMENETAWWNFRDQSKRITVALDDAIAAWKSAASQAVADAEALPLPPKPAV